MHAAAAFADMRFRHLGTEDGLSGERAVNVLQDEAGYIWVATDNGLNRYDGFNFKVFKHDPNNSASLSADFVRVLHQDAAGHLWLGTYGGGLDCYEPDSESFRHYRHIDGDASSIASDKIWALNSMDDGSLLIGTYDAGLDVFNPVTLKIRHFVAADETGLSANRINYIAKDKQGRIWVATSNGLDLFDYKQGRFIAYTYPGGSKDDNFIWSISEDQQHRLWLATSHGLKSFMPGVDSALQDSPIANITGVPKNGALVTTFIDSRSNVWLGSAFDGLYLTNASSKRVTNFHQEPGNPDSLSSNTIWEIYEDRGGLTWIATDSGLNVLDARLFGVEHIKPFSIDGLQPGASNKVQGVFEHDGALLVGSTAGIYRVSLAPNPNNDVITPFTHTNSALYGIVTSICDGPNGSLVAATSHNYMLTLDEHGHITKSTKVGAKLGIADHSISHLMCNHDGSYYLATFGNGLLRFNINDGDTRWIASNDSSGLAKNDIVEDILALTPGKRLLVGTFRGLFDVDVENDRSSLISLKLNATEPVIQSLHRTPDGAVWVGTYDGLWKLNLDATGKPQQKQFFGDIPLLRSSPILSVESDDQGNLWLAQINTLIRFNPKTHETMLLGRDQGMPPMEYYSYTHLRTSDGKLWFGGVLGIVGFDPARIEPNALAPQVVITGAVIYRKDKAIHARLESVKPLQLDYEDSIITFNIAAMDFAAPAANTYSYRLLGFKSEWTPPSSIRQITFTNLNPGRYRLEVKAANNWGTWSTKNSTLELQVLPPWWRTWWAYTLYLLAIISSSLAYVYNLKRKIKREKEVSASLREANAIKTHFVEELETQVNKATLDLRETLQGVNLKNAELEIAQKRAAEGEQIKSQFLANMSHELRTPLTGVLGYTKLLGSTNLSSEQKDYVGTIRQSSESLLAIINDTLDLSRLEAGKLLIDEVDFDLLEVIESTLELLAPIAYQKRLELVRLVPSGVPLQLRGDPLRLRQILTNLLSNAIKFTESGSVCLRVAELARDERSVTLSLAVLDTGIGIPRNELDKLFHAYARSRISTQHHVEGTGLGLAICKKLVDLMDGEIKVDSRLGQGSTFEFRLKFKTQKHMEPRASLPERPRILLYDSHPQSNDAWRACLERMGAQVMVIADVSEAGAMQADAAVMALTERELSQLQDLKQKFSPTLPPMLILAPRIERQSLKDLSETLFHRVLSKTAREKTVYLELQSLVQRAVRAQPEVAAAPETAATVPSAEAPLILVADDNRINRRLLVTMLRQAGFRAAEAGNGHELLDLAKREPWHAVLMDIHMPGMDGIEAAGRLHAAMGDKVPPIIAMSADVMPETRRQVLGSLMNDFLMKPFTEQELVAMLHRHLERHARGRLTPAS